MYTRRRPLRPTYSDCCRDWDKGHADHTTYNYVHFKEHTTCNDDQAKEHTTNNDVHAKGPTWQHFFW